MIKRAVNPPLRGDIASDKTFVVPILLQNMNINIILSYLPGLFCDLKGS